MKTLVRVLLPALLAVSSVAPALATPPPPPPPPTTTVDTPPTNPGGGTPSAAPEPASIVSAVLGVGLATAAGRVWRRRAKR
jgi:hypothetical protein